MNNGKTVVQRAAEFLRDNPELKYYEAMDQARRELDEVERRGLPGLFKKEKSRANKPS